MLKEGGEFTVREMRILFLSALYPPHTKGGAELSTHYLAQGLRELGHDVVVISASPDRRREDTVDGVPVIRVPLALAAKPLFERAWARRMGKHLALEIKRHQPFDIIHCHDFRTAQVVGQMNIRGAVVTVRDYAFICGSPNNILADGSPCPGCEKVRVVMKNRAVVEAPWWRKPFRAWQYWHNIAFRKVTLSQFKHQVFISHAQKKIIEEQHSQPGTNQAVIYNSVPAAYIATAPVRAVGKTIVFVGTVESYKGVGILLEAFRLLGESENNVQLKIVGEGAQKRQYEQQVARWGLHYRVSFAGRVAPERMGSVYDEALFVVSPHIWAEPFGRTVVEAMARERVVVAAKAGGPAEIIQDGVTGFLFERGSAEALRQALKKALGLSEIDRRTMQKAARGWVVSNLPNKRIAKQYEDFYRIVLQVSGQDIEHHAGRYLE